jgi:RNA polymerase sigma factor (sigma-70 family)
MQQTLEWADAQDVRAVEGAYRLHGEEIHRIMARKFGQDKADDIVQETFAKAAEAIPQGMFRSRGANSLRSWLITIAVRKGIDEYKRRARRPEYPNENLYDDTCAYAPASTQHVEDEVIGSLMFEELLRDTIEKVDNPEFMSAFLRIAVMGDSYKNYAADHGVSVGTAGSRLSRAKALLGDVDSAVE